MNWFRFYVDTLNNPKIDGLAGNTYKMWCKFMCVARICDGVLPNEEDLAYRLRLTTHSAVSWRNTLEALKLVDKRVDGRYEMHQWNEHQPVSDNVTERVRKHRAKQANPVPASVPELLHETFPVTDRTEQSREQNRTEEKRAEESAPEIRARVTEPFETFREAYEHFGKPISEQEWRMAGIEWVSQNLDPKLGDVMAALREDFRAKQDLIRSHDYDRIKWPVNWLRTKPWERKTGNSGRKLVSIGTPLDEPVDLSQFKRILADPESSEDDKRIARLALGVA